MTDPDDTLKAAQAALKKSGRIEADEKKIYPEDHTTQNDTAPHKSTDPSIELSTLPFVGSFFEKTGTAWSNFTGPIATIFGPPVRQIIKIYRWSYRCFASKLVVSADPSTPENRRFSPPRVAAVTLALIALTLFIPFWFVTEAIPFTARTSYDAIMLTTVKEDQLYLSRPDPVDLNRDIFQVTGCRDITGCEGGNNTIYYRLRPNIIMSIKYWTTRFEPFDPAEISGAMVSELNDCTIRYYGRRVKALGWYPYIISASCRPVSAV